MVGSLRLGVLLRKERWNLLSCVDYRRLNDTNRKDCLLLPKISDYWIHLPMPNYCLLKLENSNFCHDGLHSSSKNTRAHSSGNGLFNARLCALASVALLQIRASGESSLSGACVVHLHIVIVVGQTFRNSSIIYRVFQSFQASSSNFRFQKVAQ
jgi:hypothetical protein